jgi:hypothetical protein
MIRFKQMHLDGKPYGIKQPAVICSAFHPASVKVEDLLYQTLHWLNKICSLFVNLSEFGLSHNSHHEFPLF